MQMYASKLKKYLLKKNLLFKEGRKILIQIY